MKRKAYEPWWIGAEESLLGAGISMVWNRDYGREYTGTVSAYDPETKRHLIVFDDGDERWYRMERKIFSMEDSDGTKRAYHGEMQVRRQGPTTLSKVSQATLRDEGLHLSDTREFVISADFGTVAYSPTATSFSKITGKVKVSKSKKSKKQVLVRTHMNGKLTMIGTTATIKGFWDESKKQVSDESKRDLKKIFHLEQCGAPTAVPPASPPEVLQASDDSEDDVCFEGGNCCGFFSAQMSADSAYQQFDDNMMLLISTVKVGDGADDDGDVYRKAKCTHDITGIGGNVVGFYRLYGYAEPDDEAGLVGASSFNVTLVREYFPEKAFEEEKLKFNKLLR
jgi:hypothetical protein